MEKSVTKLVDSIGRIAIPNDLRSQVGIEIGTEVEISVDGDRIWLKASVPRCTFCKDEVSNGDVQLRGKFVCGECVRAINN